MACDTFSLTYLRSTETGTFTFKNSNVAEMCFEWQITIFNPFCQTLIRHLLKAQHFFQRGHCISEWVAEGSYLISRTAHAQHLVRAHGSDTVRDQLVAVGPGGGDNVFPRRHFFQLKPKGT